MLLVPADSTGIASYCSAYLFLWANIEGIANIPLGFHLEISVWGGCAFSELLLLLTY